MKIKTCFLDNTQYTCITQDVSNKLAEVHSKLIGVSWSSVKVPKVHIVNQQPVSETSKDEDSQKTSGQTVIVEGLDSGTVIGIAFAAFIIGVLLVAALWFIHTHTGLASQILELYLSLVIPDSICNLQCLNE